MYPEWILQNRENYEFILKQNSHYSTTRSIWSQSFSCTSVENDEGLQYLIQQYNLERLKKGRTDMEVCLRAMEWTFQQLLYKEQSDYDGLLNAFEILKFSKSTRTTVNCLCHATVLVEVLLALGYKARKISCMPIDVVPFDNHVVATVFVPSLNKWIMLDPSMCCYIIDAEHNILSLYEIRNCLIHDEEINVCTYSRFSNLRINNSESLTLNSSEYITYLFKNFFRFLSRDKHNSIPTKDNDIFYMLVPKGYLPSNIVQHLFAEDANVELRITDNDSFFWGLSETLGGK